MNTLSREGQQFRGQSTTPLGKFLLIKQGTVNKDTQTPGGPKGFTLKPPTLTKYYINEEYRSTCQRQLRSIIDQQQSQPTGI